MSGRRMAIVSAAVITASIAALLVGCGDHDQLPEPAPTRAAPANDPTDAHASPPTAPATEPRRLLLVTWDTTRADHLGVYGGKAHTPCFDTVASHGILYEHAYAVAPITLPSHTSILTGVDPLAHGVRHNVKFTVQPGALLLSEVLKAAGWKTGAFVGAYVLDPKFGLAQGFDVYVAPDTSNAAGSWGVVEKPANAVVDSALQFIDTLTPRDSWFIWLHCYDPHNPYQPPPDLQVAGKQPYDAEIEHCDRELRRLLDQLHARQLDDGLITAVTADHGESLGEHGEQTHSVFLYDSTMHVPLVIAPPPTGTAPGTRVQEAVSNVALAVTLLERVGLTRAALPEARTPLLPDADGSDEDAPPIYLECLASFYARRWAPLRGLVWHGMKFIEAPRPELYAMATDPGETTNLLVTQPELGNRFSKRLAAFAKDHPPLDWQAAVNATADDRQRFAQLGYVLADDTDGAIPDDLPDPKDRIGLLAIRDRALLLLREGTALLGLDGSAATGRSPQDLATRKQQGEAKFMEVKRLLDELAKADPYSKLPQTCAPMVEMGLGNWAAAAVLLEKQGTELPRVTATHQNLANAYLKLGKPAWARKEMEKVVFLKPDAVSAHRWLIQVTQGTADWPAAAHWIDALLAIPTLPPPQAAELRKTREQVQKELDQAGTTPRAPPPFSDDELLPEGIRNDRR